MKKNWIILLFIVSFKMNAQNKSESIESVNIYTNNHNKINDSIKFEEVSFDNLINYPEKYRKKFIRISGFLHLDLPFCVFYKTEEDYNKKEKLNAIAFIMHKEDSYQMSKKFNNKVAIVSGIFELMTTQNELTKGVYEIHRVDTLR
jgi:hypothetical protein